MQIPKKSFKLTVNKIRLQRAKQSEKEFICFWHKKNEVFALPDQELSKHHYQRLPI